MFLTSLWSSAVGGYVCKSVLGYVSYWLSSKLAKLVIPKRGLFYRPFENDALSSNSSKAPRVISQS